AALVVSGRVRYWHVGVVAVLAGLAQAFDMPARQSYMAEIVGKADLVNAVALNSAAFNAARIVGPAVAGLIIARFGVVPAFVVNALGILAVGLTLLTLPGGRVAARRGTTMVEEIAEGLSYAARTPVIRLVLGMLLVVSITVFNFTVVVPLVARHVLGLGAEGFGFLMAALGVGAVGGALSLATLGGRQTPLRTILLAGVLSCLALVALATAAEFHAAVVLLFQIGFFSIVFMASCNTTLQLGASDALRGRVMS